MIIAGFPLCRRFSRGLFNRHLEPGLCAETKPQRSLQLVFLVCCRQVFLVGVQVQVYPVSLVFPQGAV